MPVHGSYVLKQVRLWDLKTKTKVKHTFYISKNIAHGAKLQLKDVQNSDLANLMVEFGEEGDPSRFASLQEIFLQRMNSHRERWKMLRQREAQLWLAIDQ